MDPELTSILALALCLSEPILLHHAPAFVCRSAAFTTTSTVERHLDVALDEFMCEHVVDLYVRTWPIQLGTRWMTCCDLSA